jgi:hypothetical protein
MKIAIYARVSTKDKGQDTENQLVQLREFAAKQGWQITREYVDRETGGSADRMEFQRMFADASRRAFDLLLFWSLDRLSREGVLETLQHLNRLTSCGVAYKSYTEQYFDSCGIFKDAVISILATDRQAGSGSGCPSVRRPAWPLRAPGANESAAPGFRSQALRKSCAYGTRGYRGGPLEGDCRFPMEPSATYCVKTALSNCAIYSWKQSS